MVTFSQLLNAQPGKLKDSADAWDKWSAAVDDHANRLVAAHDKVSTKWDGAASEQARTLVADAHLQASASSKALSQVKTVLNSAFTKFSQAHNDLISATDQAVNAGFSVTGEGQVTDPDNVIGRATANQRAQLSQTKTNIQDRISKAVRDATAADGQAAAALRGVMPGAPRFVNGGGDTELADFSSGGGGSGGGSGGGLPMPPNALSNAPNPRARTVLAYAFAQKGDRYVYGAAGPTTFDCSGLALRAYETIGVHLPHSAELQWAQGPRIPDGQEQPGDLVFFTEGTGRVRHVGIVEDPVKGTMIVAPHTGSHVQIQSYKNFPGGYLGFTRPGTA
jgi:cell wall-associated NlpC family hydrolase